MEIYDISGSSDIVIYKFKVGYRWVLAEVEISTKKLLILRDYMRYTSDLPDEILVGETDYNIAYKMLKDKNLVI